MHLFILLFTEVHACASVCVYLCACVRAHMCVSVLCVSCPSARVRVSVCERLPVCACVNAQSYLLVFSDAGTIVIK